MNIFLSVDVGSFIFKRLEWHELFDYCLGEPNRMSVAVLGVT